VLTRSAAQVAGTFTATNANPCVFTWTGTGAIPYALFQKVTFVGGALPGGLVASKPYYVNGITGNTMTVQDFATGVTFGSTSTGSGTVSLAYTVNTGTNGLNGGGNTGSVAVGSGSFTIPNVAGGVIIPRVRLTTNIPAAGVNSVVWGGVNCSVNLWTVAPTYLYGLDGYDYFVATGGAGWLANYTLILTQFADGAAGAGIVTGANQSVIKLAAGQTIFWDLQIMTLCLPVISQTFNLAVECLN
jgi:hypothetical protein